MTSLAPWQNGSKFLFAWLLLTACLPVQSWGAVPKPSGSGDEAEDTHLTVMRDFNRDGLGDVASSAPSGDGSDSLTISLGEPDGTFRRTGTSLPLNHKVMAMAAGDFNKDGIPDLVVGDDSGAVKVFLSDGQGHLRAAGTEAHLGSVRSIVVADFNQDGIPDLAVSDWQNSSVKVMLGTGDSTFESGWSFPLRMAGTTPHLVTADFNGDGFIDLAVVYSDDDGDTYDVMLGDGRGLFSHAPQLSLVKDHNAHCAP